MSALVLLCVYIYIYICVCVCVCVCVCARARVCARASVSQSASGCLSVCPSVCLAVCLSERMQAVGFRMNVKHAIVGLAGFAGVAATNSVANRGDANHRLVVGPFAMERQLEGVAGEWTFQP